MRLLGGGAGGGGNEVGDEWQPESCSVYCSFWERHVEPRPVSTVY